jgi:CubicO group peptidase (beta-lactamase class C family)
MGHLRPSTGFRQAWQYQNLHYTTASHIVPSLTGVRFIDYVQKNIWDPMGMINSHYLISRARETGRLADGFVKVERNATECAHKMNGTDWSGVLRGQEVKVHRACLGETKSVGWFIAGDGEPHAGPGGVITCAEDMVRSWPRKAETTSDALTGERAQQATWLQTLLLKGKSPQDGSVIIPEAILNDVSRGYTVPTGTSQWPEIGVMTYGMGQQRATYRGFEYIEHGGADTGQMSQVIRVPSKGIGIAIIVNDDAYGTAYHTVAKWRILDEMLGLEPINWEERWGRRGR